jgi:hypothetical protein
MVRPIVISNMVFERPRTVMIRVGAGMIGSAPTGGLRADWRSGFWRGF